MKFELLIFLGLAATTVEAHHKCDDVNTRDTLAMLGPLVRAVEKAKQDLNNVRAAKEQLDSTLDSTNNALRHAETTKMSAEAAFLTTQRRIDSLKAEYKAAREAVANCKPTDPNSGCDIIMKNQLALRLSSAGEKMIANDVEHNKNKNVYEQAQMEFLAANSENQFDQSGYNTKKQRIMIDLESASQTYQALRDELEMKDVTGQDAQRACMIEQFDNDMAEIERIKCLLKKCQIGGCSQFDYDQMADTCDINDTVNNPQTPMTDDRLEKLLEEKRKAGMKVTSGGKITFPDCGPTITAECLFNHYESYGWFDFINVFSYIPALILCSLFDGYDYGFCLGNFWYAVVDKLMRVVAPYHDYHQHTKTFI